MARAQDDYIRPVSSGPGIHFDPIGSLKLINNYLSVVIPIDLSYIEPHLNNIKNIS